MSKSSGVAAWLRQGQPTSGKVLEASVISGKLAERCRQAWGWKREGDRWVPAAREPLRPIGLHECRHTYASFLMASRYTN